MNAEIVNESLLAEIEDHAVNIAREAGQILQEQFTKPLEIRFKGKKGSNPVTSADRLSEEYLKRAIIEKFPLHNILSEEGDAPCGSDSPFVWVLDPLDGTSNFMTGLPLFAVSVGVLWKGRPVAGSIYTSVSHRLTEGVYHARLGRGAFLNSEKIEVSKQPPGRPLLDIPVQLGRRLRFTGRQLKGLGETRNLGTIALEMAMTAGGVFQYALFNGPRLWDIAAGVLVIKEAGGVTFTGGSPGKGWRLLEGFSTAQENSSEICQKLRKWSLPLVAGAPEAVGKAVKDFQVLHSPSSGKSGRLRLSGR